MPILDNFQLAFTHGQGPAFQRLGPREIPGVPQGEWKVGIQVS